MCLNNTYLLFGLTVKTCQISFNWLINTVIGYGKANLPIGFYSTNLGFYFLIDKLSLVEGVPWCSQTNATCPRNPVVLFRCLTNITVLI